MAWWKGEDDKMLTKTLWAGKHEEDDNNTPSPQKNKVNAWIWGDELKGAVLWGETGCAKGSETFVCYVSLQMLQANLLTKHAQRKMTRENATKIGTFPKTIGYNVILRRRCLRKQFFS